MAHRKISPKTQSPIVAEATSRYEALLLAKQEWSAAVGWKSAPLAVRSAEELLAEVSARNERVASAKHAFFKARAAFEEIFEKAWQSWVAGKGEIERADILACRDLWDHAPRRLS